MLTCFILFCLLLTSGPAGLHLDDDLGTWIEDLGADDWAKREEAARRILESGPEAVVALRATLLDPDPEIRARAKELLAILSPPVLHLDVIRVANLSGSSLLSSRDEITGTTIRFHQNNLIQTSVTSKKEDRRIQAEIRGTEPPYSVEILFPGINTASISGPPSRGVKPGIPWVVFTEERVVMEKAKGKTETTGELATWVALLSNDLEGQIATLSPQQRISDAIARQLPSSRDPNLMLLAGVWPATGPIPPPPTDAEPRLLDATWISRLCRQDPQALEEFSQLISSHLEGIEVLSTERVDALIGPLIEAGVDRSVDLFVQHRGDLSPWNQHLTWLALQTRIQDPEFIEAHGRDLIEAIMSPEALPVLRWTNSRMASLWTALQEVVPASTWKEVLAGRLTEALAEDIAQSSGRIPLLLGTLCYLSNRFNSLPDGWEEPVAKLLSTHHAEIALAVFTAQNRQSDLSDEVWLQVIDEFASGMANSDNTVSFRIRASLTRFAKFDFLSNPVRKAFLQMLSKALLEGAPSHRSHAEQLLSNGTGGEPQPRQRTKSDDYYQKRAKYWQQRLKEIPDEELYARSAERGNWIQLSMADLRIDPAGQMKPLRTQRLVLQTGQKVIRIGDGGDDESILIENSANNTYRLSGSVLMFKDRPLLTRMRPRWRRWAHRFNSTRLGPESAEIRSNITYQTLVLLKPLDDEIGSAQPGWDPTVKWSDFEDAVLEALGSDVHSTRLAAVDIVTTLKLSSALNPLIDLWEESPHDSIAGALLVLGDHRGKERLISTLTSLETRVTRDGQKALDQLLSIGDPSAVNKVLGWLEVEPAKRNRILENQLPRAIQALETLLSKDQFQELIPRDRLLAALVQRTDTRNLRNYAIPMLRRLTGIDLGWWNTFSITDSKERSAAQEEVGELWKDWWARKNRTK
ncbi:MAG: hypothetical protein VX764_08490 [Planctomycetota bacterium]|nr:hypothetical protein [Planctomycetota bacterium]